VHAFLDHDAPVPIVHRGAPLADDGALVENTMAAFERAYAQGFRYFETDVHATADGMVVACHDASLKRVAGHRARIFDVQWSDLSRLLVGEAPVPTLAELLSAFPDVKFNIDPKSDAVVRPLVDLVRSSKVLDRTCFASFSDARLRWIRAAFGTWACTAAGPRQLRRAVTQAARSQRLDLPDVDVLQIPRLLAARLTTGRFRTLDLLAAAQRVDLPVHVWTVNDEVEIAGLLQRGAEGVMSDHLGALERAFARNGWQPAS
jgi:glycerophosphoryl diester phosphodiesterase